jgi:hypothetical protein
MALRPWRKYNSRTVSTRTHVLSPLTASAALVCDLFIKL